MSDVIYKNVIGVNVSYFNIVSVEFGGSSDQVVKEIPDLFLYKVFLEHVSVVDLTCKCVGEVVESYLQFITQNT